jgi:AAA+ superfamily predicted ATPase
VVSTLLLQVDRLPSHVVVVTATNHPELLDRAVWRRFQLRLELPNPGQKAIACLLSRYREQMRLDLGCEPAELAEHLEGASFGEVEEFSLDLLRRQVLAHAKADPAEVLRERLAQWRTRYSPPARAQC